MREKRLLKIRNFNVALSIIEFQRGLGIKIVEFFPLKLLNS